jgi:NADH-quinone oxidoreductase subunit K
MTALTMEHGLMVASVLFALGLFGLLARRNVIFVLMSLEIMMNASALAFVSAGARWVQPDGQIMFILILSLAASEVAVGLALVLQVYRRYVSLDTDALSTMKG